MASMQVSVRETPCKVLTQSLLLNFASFPLRNQQTPYCRRSCATWRTASAYAGDESIHAKRARASSPHDPHIPEETKVSRILSTRIQAVADRSKDSLSTAHGLSAIHVAQRGKRPTLGTPVPFPRHIQQRRSWRRDEATVTITPMSVTDKARPRSGGRTRRAPHIEAVEAPGIPASARAAHTSSGTSQQTSTAEQKSTATNVDTATMTAAAPPLQQVQALAAQPCGRMSACNSCHGLK